MKTIILKFGLLEISCNATCTSTWWHRRWPDGQPADTAASSTSRRSRYSMQKGQKSNPSGYGRTQNMAGTVSMSGYSQYRIPGIGFYPASQFRQLRRSSARRGRSPAVPESRPSHRRLESGGLTGWIRPWLGRRQGSCPEMVCAVLGLNRDHTCSGVKILSVEMQN